MDPDSVEMDGLRDSKHVLRADRVKNRKLYVIFNFSNSFLLINRWIKLLTRGHRNGKAGTHTDIFNNNGLDL